MVEKLNPNILIKNPQRKLHTKASEEYLDVEFIYPEGSWKGWVPVEYRRTGLSLKSKEEEYEYLNKLYDLMKPENKKDWLKDQEKFWQTKKNASVTKSFFDCLAEGGWKCVRCQLPPNPNWARRIQDLKEDGYTIATDTKRYCSHCGSNQTHLILLPIERGEAKGNGYETWSQTLRKRIITTLEGFDVYENVKSTHCLPDHKFPEIRWDSDTKDINREDMTTDEIKKKFQLLTNQRNQQKREVCRKCFQTGKRPYPFGIKYYYKGNENWDTKFPTKGKNAEKGCEGCGWYDLQMWRESLMKDLNKGSSHKKCFFLKWKKG